MSATTTSLFVAGLLCTLGALASASAPSQATAAGAGQAPKPPTPTGTAAIAAADLLNVAGSWKSSDGVKTVYTVPAGRYFVLTGIQSRIELLTDQLSWGQVWLFRDGQDVLEVPLGDLLELRTGIAFPPGSMVQLEFDYGEDGYYSLSGHLRSVTQHPAETSPADFVVVTKTVSLTPGFPAGPVVTVFDVPPGKRLVITDRLAVHRILAGPQPNYVSVMVSLHEDGDYKYASFVDEGLPRLVFQPGSSVGVSTCCSGSSPEPVRLAFSGYLEDV